MEFVTWASVTDLRQVRQLLLDSGKENVGVVVDCLHFYRSRVQLHELEECPRSWFHYAHLCDCEAPIPTDEAALIHTGRAERLYPGDHFQDPAGGVRCGSAPPDKSGKDRL